MLSVGFRSTWRGGNTCVEDLLLEVVMDEEGVIIVGACSSVCALADYDEIF